MPKANSPTNSTTNPSIVHQNVEAVLALQNAEEQRVTRHQQTVERLVVIMTYPSFFFGIIAIVTLWIGINIGLRASGHRPWDHPPFAWLQTTISILALLMTSVLVITQSRQGKVAERHAHLDLQINLLVDQRVAKVIQLLEEMRTDSPTLRDRRDEVAEKMQVGADPMIVASIIAEKMNLANSATVAEDDLVNSAEEDT